ncbi:MAG TPA: HAMP domain-containing sensor histidine kinase [Polyangia bacterium]|nr:HAMP domain-containing sensor histidine kinase [Polyangia bacterium]
MKVRSPTNVFLYRARLIFTLTALVPTVFASVIGVVLVASGSQSVTLVGGILLLVFCATALTGYVLGTIFVTRGASLAAVQNEFLASVSHELRTPLTSIRMFIDTLREGRVQDPDERQRCLNVIHQELSRLDGLVAKLFTLSKIESPHAAFERQLVAVSDIIDEALAAFGAIRFGSEVDLRVKVEPAVQVYGDRAALAQAVANLLGNALKYTPPQGKRIEIDATADAKSVFIAVSDNGRGVPRNEQEIIFEKFQRGSAANDGLTVGTGLGLAVVRAIVKAHRGKVDVRSDGDQGSRFCITLPRRVPEAA